MKSFISVIALALLASMPGVIAHIDMQDPPPIRHKNNPNTKNPDTDYTAPIKQLCKGYQNLGGDELKPVATWQAGSQQKFVLGGSAVHGGGSCQASISEDGGKTFKAIKSYIGDCPHASGNAGTFDFTVPKDTKDGDVLFAWTWFNKIGNREMYMNCASIKITGGGSGLSSYPDILQANIGNGCTTADNKDVLFPDPGKDVVTAPGAATAPPVGSCGTSAPVDTPPVDTPPVETPPVETPVETPPVETPPVETPPVETPVETPPVETPPVETPVDEDPEEPVKDEEPVTPPPTNKPPTNGGSCTEGEIICDSETTFSLCSNGTPVSMGKTASGTKCTGGKIVKRAPIRFSPDHMAARRV